MGLKEEIEAKAARARTILDGAQCIIPGLYLGNVVAARNPTLLQDLEITHILTVAPGIAPPFPDKYEYKVVEIRDDLDEDLFVHVRGCVEFVTKARSSGGAVLCHCEGGISRSAAVVAACVMYADFAPTAAEAVKLVQSKRRYANPNATFLAQLQRLEELNWETLPL